MSSLSSRFLNFLILIEILDVPGKSMKTTFLQVYQTDFLISKSWLILEDWCMVLVFDKKTPENAFNRTKSNRVVGYNIYLLVNFCLNESYSLLLLKLNFEPQGSPHCGCPDELFEWFQFEISSGRWYTIIIHSYFVWYFFWSFNFLADTIIF